MELVIHRDKLESSTEREREREGEREEKRRGMFGSKGNPESVGTLKRRKIK